MHLRYCLYGACMKGENRHAQIVMKELGLSYQHATPQSMGDQWWFWNVEGDTSNLPEYIEEANLDPVGAIGYGLDEETAIKIRDYNS